MNCWVINHSLLFSCSRYITPASCLSYSLLYSWPPNHDLLLNNSLQELIYFFIKILGNHDVIQFLAHLSQRLTRWAYSIPMVCRLSVICPSSSTLSNLNISEASWPVLIKFYVLITVMGERLHKVLSQIGSLRWAIFALWATCFFIRNSSFHGNRKPPLTCNVENDVSTFLRLLLIRSFLYLQLTRTCIKSRTSSNFSQIGTLTTELAALERLKNVP